MDSRGSVTLLLSMKRGLLSLSRVIYYHMMISCARQKSTYWIDCLAISISRWEAKIRTISRTETTLIFSMILKFYLLARSGSISEVYPSGLEIDWAKTCQENYAPDFSGEKENQQGAEQQLSLLQVNRLFGKNSIEFLLKSSKRIMKHKTPFRIF